MARFLAPFRRVRRWLKRINYYSASKGRSPWQRAADVWLILSLPVAFGAALLVDELVSKSTAAPLITIRLGKDSANGPVRGWIERERSEPWAIGIPLGSATVFTTLEIRGWPLVTIETDGPTTVKYTDFQDTCTLLVSPLPEQWQETTDAIALALDTERMAPIATSWIEGDTRRSRYAASFIAQTAIFWVTLFVLGIALLRFMRFLNALHRHRQRRRIVKRLGRGLCPGCRYDLSGTKFPEYCPECGQRIWG